MLNDSRMNDYTEECMLAIAGICGMSTTELMVALRRIGVILADGKKNGECTAIILDEICRHSEQQFTDSIMTYATDFEKTEDELKKAIKRARNPLEKQALQREYNSIKIGSGKHKGSKRRRR